MCVARKAQGDRTVPTDADQSSTRRGWRKAGQACRTMPGRLRRTGGLQGSQMALSIIWVSWPLLTAPIWVASTLPFLNTIRVGMPRTP